MKHTDLTIFDCEADEADLFHRLAPDFNITPRLLQTSAKCGLIPDACSPCVSIGHKSTVTAADLSALKSAGAAYICTRSIGYDHIDIHAAGRLGIAIGHAAYAPDGVADYTVMLLLMALRGIKSLLSCVEHKDFRAPSSRSRELCDMTVGVVGAGHIGGAVVKRLRGFGCHVLVCSPEYGTDSVPLYTLLAKSDIVTLHVPLSADTYHMLGREQFALMKPDAILVNTARGALVDTEALILALDSHRLGGAALDVLEGEKDIFYYDCSAKTVENPFLARLLEMPNVMITPHTAYYTHHALYDTVAQTLLQCTEFERRHSHA